MAKKKHNEDKKLHNFNEKLHNSDVINDRGPDLTWQERVDLLPEDEVEGGSEIYYFTDEDGNLHSREFLAEELIADDVEDPKDSLKGKPEHGKAQRLKPGAMEIVNLVPASQETQHEITLPAPKSGERPLDIRISSEIAPDLFTKKESQQPSAVIALDKHTVVHLHDGFIADKPVSAAQDSNADAPLKLSFTRATLDGYVAYRSEGIAKKSKDWINRASQALWESAQGEISPDYDEPQDICSQQVFVGRCTQEGTWLRCCFPQVFGASKS